MDISNLEIEVQLPDFCVKSLRRCVYGRFEERGAMAQYGIAAARKSFEARARKFARWANLI